jgi:hypothetical protein
MSQARSWPTANARNSGREVCGFYGLAKLECLGCRYLPGGTRGSRQTTGAIQHTAVRPMSGNGDERGVVERSGRTSHLARDWMRPPDAEYPAVRTNAATSVGRLPLRGDLHNSCHRRADAGRDNAGFSSWAGQRGRYRLGYADVQAAPLRRGLQLSQRPRPPHRLLGPHQVHPHRRLGGLLRFLRCPVAAMVSYSCIRTRTSGSATR